MVEIIQPYSKIILNTFREYGLVLRDLTSNVSEITPAMGLTTLGFDLMRMEGAVNIVDKLHTIHTRELNYQIYKKIPKKFLGIRYWTTKIIGSVCLESSSYGTETDNLVRIKVKEQEKGVLETLKSVAQKLEERIKERIEIHIP